MSDERTYKEITLPGGTFRMYDDRPNVWIQQLKPGEKSINDRIREAYDNGNMKGSKK